MKILIDADGCPVVELALREAKRNNLECLIVCDTAHEIEKEGAKTIVVSKGADSADFKVANLAQPGDIVVTQDYGLAAMCLARNAAVLSQNGLIFTNDNIDGLLLSRHTAKKLRRGGVRMSGPPKRTAQDDEHFEKALALLLAKSCKKE